MKKGDTVLAFNDGAGNLKGVGVLMEDFDADASTIRVKMVRDNGKHEMVELEQVVYPRDLRLFPTPEPKYKEGETVLVVGKSLSNMTGMGVIKAIEESPEGGFDYIVTMAYTSAYNDEVRITSQDVRESDIEPIY